jgi:methanethiol S-methyltransferase
MGFLTIAYSAIAYLLFLGVLGYTVGFVANVPWLPKTIDSGVTGDRLVALTIDLALLGLFAVQHSVMARRGFKQWWTRIVPKPAERSTYVLAASLAVALLLWQWRPLGGVVWNFEGAPARMLLMSVSAVGWITLLVATFLINHFELFGLYQAYARLRGTTSTSPQFRTPGLYRMVRHPIYLGFILAFWGNPTMTEGHLLFAIATTGYIFVGIWFEERDLVAQFGAAYRAYRKRVPMIVPLPFARGDAQPRDEAARHTTAP